MNILDYKKGYKKKSKDRFEELVSKEERPQGGRPKAISKRTQKIEIRCDSFEKKAIQELADQTGMSTAEYCRTVALGIEPKFKLTEEELKLYDILVEYKTNFARISNYIQNNQAVSNEVIKVSKALSEQLKMFLK